MPIQKALYPPDWNKISKTLKSQKGWVCEHCKRPCRAANESLVDFVTRLSHGRARKPLPPINESDEAFFARVKSQQLLHPNYWDLLESPTRYVLTVAHLDQNPGRNDDDNLRALCVVCHLRLDNRIRGLIRASRLYSRRERLGQLACVPTGDNPSPEMFIEPVFKRIPRFELPPQASAGRIRKRVPEVQSPIQLSFL